MKNTMKKSQDCGAARILHQAKMGQHSSPKGWTTGFLSSCLLMDCCKKEKQLFDCLFIIILTISGLGYNDSIVT